MWPALTCAVVVVALMGWRTPPRRAAAGWAVAAGTAVAVLLAVRYASRVANPVFGLTLVGVIVALGWYVAAVGMRRRKALLSGIPLLGIFLVVLLLEVPTWIGGVQSRTFDDTMA